MLSTYRLVTLFVRPGRLFVSTGLTSDLAPVQMWFGNVATHSQVRSRCVAAISYFVLLCLPSSFVLITHVSWGPVPPDLLTTYLSVLVIRTHHTTRSLLISYCTLVSTLRSISQPIPKPLTELGHLIVLYLYI